MRINWIFVFAIIIAASHNHDQIVRQLLRFYPNAALVDKNNQTAYSRGNQVKSILIALFKWFFVAIASQMNTSAKLIKTYLHELENILFESKINNESQFFLKND